MKIGYSCWGFLGNGITDTPDGGRSHRFTLLKALINQGAEIIMLQRNRDLLECGENFSQRNLSFETKFPNIDALFLEYRWKIKGRNYGVSKENKLYTPDLDRQNELIRFYQAKNIPIIIWDKDQKLSENEQKKIKNSVVFEPALKPKFNRKTLLFPMDDKKTNFALNKIKQYNKNKKSFKLIYIGNQYGRDDSFKEFINNPAGKIDTETPVFGNWNKYLNTYKKNLIKFSNVTFKRRLGFNEVNNIYKKSLFTVLIAPDRYYKSGQFTQRLFEAMWGLCIPFVPRKYYGINKVILKDFIVNSGNEVEDKIEKFYKKSDSEIKKLFKKQFKMLNLFKPGKQAKIIINEIKKYYK